MTVWIYMKDPATGRIHLMNPEELFRVEVAKTLCGLRAERLTELDETMSGFRCNCYTCRDVMVGNEQES